MHLEHQSTGKITTPIKFHHCIYIVFPETVFHSYIYLILRGIRIKCQIRSHISITRNNLTHQIHTINNPVHQRTIFFQVKTKISTESRIIKLVIKTVAINPWDMSTQCTDIIKIKMFGYSQIVTVQETISIILFRQIR